LAGVSTRQKEKTVKKDKRPFLQLRLRKQKEEMDMAGMVVLGLILAGLAGYLVYALVYPEKL